MKQDNTTVLTPQSKPSNKGHKVVKTATERAWRPSDKLTRKQNAVVYHLVTDPKISATEAITRAYNVKSRATARVMATEVMHKPHVMAELAKYSTKAELTVLDVMAY